MIVMKDRLAYLWNRLQRLVNRELWMLTLIALFSIDIFVCRSGTL